MSTNESHSPIKQPKKGEKMKLAEDEEKINIELSSNRGVDNVTQNNGVHLVRSRVKSQN